MSHLRVELRLETPVHVLNNQFAPAARLVEELRLRANASFTTRTELRHLIDMVGALWETHNRIAEEATAIRTQMTNPHRPAAGN